MNHTTSSRHTHPEDMLDISSFVQIPNDQTKSSREKTVEQSRFKDPFNLDVCKKCNKSSLDPRALVCGHSFCFCCLNPENPHQCSFCQKETPRTKSGSPSVNWLAAKNKDQKNVNPTKSTNEVFCDACDSTTPNHATKWCPSCSANYCDACDVAAHTLKNLRTHYRSALESKTNFPVCLKHNKNKEIYNKETGELQCLVCFFVGSSLHSGKSQAGIPYLDYTKQQRNELHESLTPIKDTRCFQVKQQHLNSRKIKIESEIKSLEDKISALKSELAPIDSEILQTQQLFEKVQVCDNVLTKAIEEIAVVDLLDKDKVQNMKIVINEIIQEITPRDAPKMTKKPMLMKKNKAFVVKGLEIPKSEGNLFEGNSKTAIMEKDYKVNKGTLLTSGKHSWKILCEEVIGPVDLGVVSASHATHFNISPRVPTTAWGIRTNGYILGHKKILDKKAAFNQGDEVEFFLDLESGKMKIVVNNGYEVEMDNIVGPVHIAFSGQQGAKVRIL